MHRRWLVRGLLVVASLSPPWIAEAAEITDVADAGDAMRVGGFEHVDPFDLYLDNEFGMVMENGKITREPIDRPGLTGGCVATNPRNCLPVDELRYARNTSIYKLRGQIGLFHDLALTFGWRYVVDRTLKFRYAKNVSADNSTVDSPDPTIGTLFRHDFQSWHKGAGALDVGLRFAPLSDERDESKPAWVIGVDWSTPWTTKTYDPEIRATKSKPGPVGDGVHRLTFTTSLSKRLGSFGLIGIDPNLNRRGYLDPYFEIAYTLPIPQRGRALDALVKRPGRPFRRSPSHEGTLNAGFEVVPIEDLKSNHKLAVDFGLRTRYVGQGRNYSELTDPLGRLTYTDQHFYVGGLFGIYAQVAQILRLKAGVGLGYVTEHFLTNEDVGRDRNGDGQVTGDDGDPTTVDDVLNPYYCGVAAAAECAGGALPYDEVGFRFKDEEHVVFNGFVSLMLTF